MNLITYLIINTNIFMLKGITPVIAVILLLMITISIAGVAFLFFSRATESAAGAGTRELEQQTRLADTRFSIEGVDKNKVYIRNLGISDLNAQDLAFYVNDAKMESDNTTIAPNAAGTVSLNDSQLSVLPDSAELRVTSAVFSDKITANFYGKYLVANWEFDEGFDLIVSGSPNGNYTGETMNNGTVIGAAWVEGRYGKAVQFDGIDDYINLSDSASLTGDAMTIGMWIYPTSVGGGTWRGLISRRDACGAPDWQLHLENTDGSLSFSANSVLDSNYIPPVNTWTHVAVSFVTGGSAIFYANGVQVFSGLTPGRTANTAARIGTDGTCGNEFAGTIDEIRIYNRALNHSEIQEDMNSSFPVARPAASYRFEEGSGNVAKDSHIWVKGKYDASLSFDGANDYVKLPTTDFPTNSFTISAWIKPNSVSGTGSFWVRGRDGGSGRVTLERSGTSWRLAENVGASISGGTATADQWTHVVAVIDGDNSRLYQGGVLIASGDINQSIDAGGGAQIHYIGRGEFAAANFWNGDIDEFKIYNVARTMTVA